MSTAWSTATLVGWLSASLTIAIASIVGTAYRGCAWRHALTGLAGSALLAASVLSLRDPLASMASYSAALMVLNQWVPPLLLMAVPAAYWTRWRGTPAPRPARGIAGWLLDPWVAGSVFAMFSISVSVPGIFEPALANALFSAPLAVFELLTGVLFWAQLFRCLRTIKHDWQVGLFAIVGSMPMMAVAVVWMLSPHVLYMPYQNVICRWNISPLADQHWAGFVMLLTGLPLQVAGAWRVASVSFQDMPASPH
jgi:putative membrane protein